jgi:hypothetical protein
VVAVYNTTNTLIYVNGAFISSPAPDSSTIYYNGDGTSDFGDMGCGSAQEYFKGELNDVRIYNRALSAQEILQLYLLGK